MINLSNVSPCYHEEADTCIYVHAKDAALQGHKVLTIKASDTVVVVIAISTLLLLKQYGLQKLWIDFGQAAHLKWIPGHDLLSTIWP